MDYSQKYKKYKAKYLNLLGKNMTGGSNSSKPTMYLFKMTGCGHCETFEPTWQKLQINEKLNNKINFEKYDVRIEKDSEFIKKFENKYMQIKGFPTIILEKNGKIEEYRGSRDEDAMVKWISKN